MGCLKLTYNEKEDLNFFQGLWKKSDGSKKCDNYYPFGLAFNSYSRENSVPNKIKFQGQEHVDDLGLNWDSYRYRNHQPDIGRFFNIDPMASAFYYNSPYAFSENKVTTHREMEGLEAFFIHGTISDNSMWKKDVADFIMRELKPYFSTDQTADTGFKWNDYAGGGVNRNWLGNSGKRERATAARQLVSYILKNRKQGQGITLVGHSHGGNVAIQAARILFEKHNTRVNIVNFNTPAWNGANDPENPWDNFGIDEMMHFFTDGDLVAGPLSGESNYGGLVGSNVTQIELKTPLKTNFWGTDQHAFENVNWQEVLSRFAAMNNNGSSGTGESKKKKKDADKEACKRSGGCK
jgi:RHS repeat-associated protein